MKQPDTPSAKKEIKIMDQVKEAKNQADSQGLVIKDNESDAVPPELDDEDALSLMNGAENDCPCILAKDSRDMCQEGKCYHHTGQGFCGECADGFGITVPSLLRIGYKAGYALATKPRNVFENNDH